MARDTFAFRVRTALGHRTPAWLAATAGIPDSSIRKYLAGASPSIDAAAQIAVALAVTLDWLAAMPSAGPMRPVRTLRGRRPPWWSDVPVREFVISSHREMTLDQVRAEIAARFGTERVPGRSSIGRVWKRIDSGHLVRGA